VHCCDIADVPWPYDNGILGSVRSLIIKILNDNFLLICSLEIARQVADLIVMLFSQTSFHYLGEETLNN
jgi:hypothetical protein